MLPDEAEIEIANRLQALRAETGIHMVVVAMDRIADHGGAGQRTESYAKALMNAWGVGDPERSDGLMMLVVAEDRQVRFALGAGYDAVYDGRAQRVIDTAILPEFRAGRIDEGVLAGVQSARDRLVAPFLAGMPVTLNDGFPVENENTSLWIGGGILALGVGLIGWRRMVRRKKPCPKCGATVNVTNEMITPAARGIDGSGLRHVTCARCGYVARETYAITPSGRERSFANRRGGGGSSGGFGGGRSSGGGATGRW